MKKGFLQGKALSQQDKVHKAPKQTQPAVAAASYMRRVDAVGDGYPVEPPENTHQATPQMSTWRSPAHDIFIEDQADAVGVKILTAAFNMPDGQIKEVKVTFPADGAALPSHVVDACDFENEVYAWEFGKSWLLKQHDEAARREGLGTTDPADLNFAIVKKEGSDQARFETFGDRDAASVQEKAYARALQCSVCDQTKSGAGKKRQCALCPRRNFCDECVVETKGFGTICLPCAHTLRGQGVRP